MTLLILGINYKTASIALRERITFGPDIVNKALNSLLLQPMINSAVLLSTCNRTELYLSVKSFNNIKQKIIEWLCKYHNLQQKDLSKSIYWYKNSEVIIHLMRVATGLDSLILGESQIFGQIKQAFAFSKNHHYISNELEQMFQKTFAIAKKVRTETKIGNNSISVAFAACNIVRKIFHSLESINLLLIGAGNTIKLITKHLKRHKVKKIIIANRTIEKAQSLANEINAEVIQLIDIDKKISEIDIIISSTSSPYPIIDENMVKHALKIRRNKPILMIDIAVPRDISSKVGKLTNIYLFNMDDLQMIIDKNINHKKSAAINAEKIIMKESKEFMIWLKAQNGLESIRTYRLKANNIRAELEERALSALHHGANPKTVMKELAYKLTNRLIHTPTKSLYKAAYDGDNERLQILLDTLGIK